jgi:hypothetical protein
VDYAQRRFGTLQWLNTLIEPRKRVRIPLRNMMLCAFLLVSSRLGSLNALAQCRSGGIWRRYRVFGALPSADQLGRVAAVMPAREVRRQLKRVYRLLKRRKALKPASHDNLYALVIDGHECCASYRRTCGDCLTRRLNRGTPQERLQYYHRHVMGVLICERFTLLLDVELQRPGEGEVSTACRLLDRLLLDYPRAFDIVVADGLYAQGPFFKKVRRAGKHVIAVLKHQQRDIMADVLESCKRIAPRSLDTAGVKRQVWDLEQLTSWPQAGMAVRAVRSLETVTVKRQSGVMETQTTQWLWVTTLSQRLLSTEQFIPIAHGRWRIENDAFNELVTHWHADHIYKHSPNAILFFWLMTMLAYDLFHAFFFLNIKPQLRLCLQKYHVAACITADLLAHDMPPRVRDP